MASLQVAPPPVACQACGLALSPPARFCHACGTPTGVASPPSPASQGAPSGAVPAEARLAPGRLPGWRAVLAMMFSPGSIIERLVGETSWLAALGVSGLAFALFFFQTGLDLARDGSAGMGRAVLLGAAGLLYGTAGVGLVGAIAWALAKPFGGRRSPWWTVRAFAIGYSPALVYTALGLPFNLFLGWNTSVAFGVTGLLWALGPMMAAIRSLTDGRTGVSVVLATACGGVLLYGWALLNAGA